MENHIVGTAHHHLGLAVHIPVVGKQIGFHITRTDHVGAHVHPPQASGGTLIPVEFVGIPNAELCGVFGGIVHIDVIRAAIRCRLCPNEATLFVIAVGSLDDEVQLPVAVKVGEDGVVGVVMMGLVVAVAVEYWLKGEIHISSLIIVRLFPFRFCRGTSHLSVHRGGDGERIRRTSLQRIVAHGEVAAHKFSIFV